MVNQVRTPQRLDSRFSRKRYQSRVTTVAPALKGGRNENQTFSPGGAVRFVRVFLQYLRARLHSNGKYLFRRRGKQSLFRYHRYPCPGRRLLGIHGHLHLRQAKRRQLLSALRQFAATVLANINAVRRERHGCRYRLHDLYRDMALHRSGAPDSDKHHSA